MVAGSTMMLDANTSGNARRPTTLRPDEQPLEEAEATLDGWAQPFNDNDTAPSVASDPVGPVVV